MKGKLLPAVLIVLVISLIGLFVTLGALRDVASCQTNYSDVEMVQGCINSPHCIIDYKDYARIGRKWQECQGK